jgi:ribosomal protein L10
MAITLAEKKEYLLKLQNLFSKAERMLVINHNSISAQELNDLRFVTKLLFPIEILVCKNSLLNLFLVKTLNVNLDFHKLPALVIFVLEDERFEILTFLKSYLESKKLTPKSKKLFSFLIAYEKRKNQIYHHTILEKTARFGSLSAIHQNFLGVCLSAIRKLLLILKGVIAEKKRKALS